MSNMLSVLMILAAPVVALPMASEVTSAGSDAKYGKDKGASRKVYLYILAAAGCLIALGLAYFIVKKYRRGERVCPGVKRTVQQKNGWHGEREMARYHHAKSTTSKRTVQSSYGATNPYEWTPERSHVSTNQWGHVHQNFQAEMPRVKQPAPVAQPIYGVARRSSPGIPIRKILPDRHGYYHI